MTYRTTKCPYCKFHLESHTTAPESDFMPSMLPCPNCDNIYATGKNYIVK